MSDYEIEEDEPVGKTLQFFKDPIKKEEVKKCVVDEAYLSAYEEMKADMKAMEETLDTMNAEIKKARMGSEKTLQLGKMVVKFTDVEGSPKVDWKSPTSSDTARKGSRKCGARSSD